MATWIVQIIIGDSFRDLYVIAESAHGAIEQAKQQATNHERRWASFVV